MAILIQKAGQYDMLSAKLKALLKRHHCFPVATTLHFMVSDVDDPLFGTRLGESQHFDTEPEALIAGMEWVIDRLQKDKP